MFKRMIAALLACLLMAAPLAALAESDDIVITDAVEAIGEVEVSDLEAPSLSLEGLESALFANEPDEEGEDEDQPIELSISKSTTKKVTLGYKYQIVLSGKTIKSCKSNDKKVATVTKAGLITPKKAGSARITITPKKGSKLTLKLKVIDPKTPTAVAIDAGSSAELNVGETLQLTATVTPDTASQKVSWKSSDKSVATVDQDGLVTAKKKGKATITVTTYNGIVQTCVVTVK